MKLISLALVVFIVALLTASLFGQADRLKPGDKIDYLEYGKWETGGTFIGTTPGAKQPLIRKKPNEFFPEGSETAWDWERIRPAAAQQPVRNQPQNVPQQPPQQPAVTANAGGQGIACGAMLGENDVLGFLQGRLGNEPFKDSVKKERAEHDLAKRIRDCGVNFRYQSLSPFSTKLDKYGATSIVRFPLDANLGPPTKQPWYIGTWMNNVQSENYWSIIAAKTGFLTISANGTYTWKLYATDPPGKYLKGRWRAATYDEMAAMYQGGAGIVLLNGKSQLDWIVRQDRNTTLKGRWIVTSDLNTHQMREFGYQK